MNFSWIFRVCSYCPSVFPHDANFPYLILLVKSSSLLLEHCYTLNFTLSSLFLTTLIWLLSLYKTKSALKPFSLTSLTVTIFKIQRSQKNSIMITCISNQTPRASSLYFFLFICVCMLFRDTCHDFCSILLPFIKTTQSPQQFYFLFPFSTATLGGCHSYNAFEISLFH